jgi:phosphotransferase system IIB component
MKNGQEYRPRIEIKGDNLIISNHDLSKIRRVKEMLESNNFDVIITGISAEVYSELKVAV